MRFLIYFVLFISLQISLARELTFQDFNQACDDLWKVYGEIFDKSCHMSDHQAYGAVGKFFEKQRHHLPTVLRLGKETIWKD